MEDFFGANLRMEDESLSMINCVPSFARGFNLLLVHDDTLTLVYLSSLLEQYSFKVTAIDQASVAASMICDHEGKFKLVVAKANMPGTDTLSFLNIMLGKDIPVIFISSGGFDSVTWTALARGSCYFLEEPIHLRDLKYVWQHVYHSKAFSAEKVQNANFKDKVHGANEKRNHDGYEGKQKEKGAELSSAQMNFYRYDHTDKVGEERREHKNGSADKRRIVWTSELHQKFIEAIRVLGRHARPKSILTMMDVPHLTVRQVASHLQKYKIQEVKNIQKACKSSLPPVSSLSNSSDNTKLPSPFESSSFGMEGLPEPTASLNESQNQNESVMNDADTQGSEIIKLQETPDNPTITYEFPTELANYGSLDATMGHLVANPSSSMDQNQPVTGSDDIIKLLEEDWDSYDCFVEGTNPDGIDQYCEMLRSVLFGDCSSSLEFDTCKPSIS